MQKQIVRLAVAAMTFAIGIALTTPFSSCPSVAFNNPPPPVRREAQSFSVEATDTFSIEETVNRLKQFKTDDAIIPTAARPLLTSLKHQLRDLISAAINAQENQGKSARQLEGAVMMALRSEVMTAEESEEGDASGDYPESDYRYGSIYGVNIRQPPSHPELLAATTAIGVRCGKDSSLYLFKRVGERWELILTQEANGYEDISGAQGMFDYAISPPDAKDDFFIVTANVNPWCTSNWQSIRYSLLRIGPSASEPQIMASGEKEIYLGVDVPYELAAGPHWLSINFEGDASKKEIMDGETSRRHVLKYIVNGEKAKKISE
jgi:hypothetical protein